MLAGASALTLCQRKLQSMMSFKEFNARRHLQESAKELLLEYEVYRQIPGTKHSYRQDSANTNTLTQQHSHVYAKLSGKGKQLYAVNFDGSGHDGSSGHFVPSFHADHFRSLGYTIPDTNILESIDSDALTSYYSILVIDDMQLASSCRLVRLLNENGSDEIDHESR